MGVIYRPSGQPLKEFNEELASLVPALIKDNKKGLLMGDFNIDLLNLHKHAPSQDFLNILSSAYFAPAINRPTRVTEVTATLSDDIFSNFHYQIENPTILISDFSEHFPIMLWFDNNNASDISAVKNKSRMINESLIEKFNDILNNYDWTDSRSEIRKGNTTAAYDSFIDKYSDLYNNTFIPFVKKSAAGSPKKEWMTFGLLKSCKTKDKLYTKYKKNPTLHNKENYIQYRNKFKKLKTIVQKTIIKMNS